jgi:hypothetical protein
MLLFFKIQIKKSVVHPNQFRHSAFNALTLNTSNSDTGIFSNLSNPLVKEKFFKLGLRVLRLLCLLSLPYCPCCPDKSLDVLQHHHTATSTSPPKKEEGGREYV